MRRALFLPMALVCLQAQVPQPWPLLVSQPSQGVELRAKGVPTPEGWQLQVKNTGTVPLHFRLDLGTLPPGVELPVRFHLDPGTKAMLALPLCPPQFRVEELRAGDDEGPMLAP